MFIVWIYWYGSTDLLERYSYDSFSLLRHIRISCVPKVLQHGKKAISQAPGNQIQCFIGELVDDSHSHVRTNFLPSFFPGELQVSDGFKSCS
ncbi:hypothetical protein L596_025661 [Steinernema carpocapsae]|uniref:Uncharacterized protein n=1 Tax=Steinernema carpocapsae TaxID=34508 RepID=A0A4U5M8F8_STECR|nr:hypothetical protein L596_025661 [Steinernema carpocapsae]